jgi:aminoglycoside phosphotransferase family enzyme/predicted kinase
MSALSKHTNSGPRGGPVRAEVQSGVGARTTGAVSTARLLAFLRDPRSYPDWSPRIRLIQTHSSWLVLTGRHAYKVKKPVDFGFLDFSTLEKRRHFCEREVMLNRRLCPDMYLGVAPISMNKGRLAFAPGGEIVEYAVKMRRLPARFFMLHRMERGEVSTRDVDAIVAALKPFYDAQKPPPAIAKWGSVAKLRVSTGENFRQTRDFIDVTITRSAFAAIRCYTTAFYRRHASLFAARVRERRILDCHGDLHLEHIHLSPARVTIYDCIEFNDRFRYVDAASDAAFLAMDLDLRGRADLAQHFARRMAKALRDPAMPRLLDFYKCYRAFVRGKVESFQLAAVGAPEAERTQCRERAARYFRLALRYAVCGSAPIVLIAMGRVASGKSTVARLLGRELGWEVFSSDRIRKELAGVPLEARVGENGRRRLYSTRMSDRTYAALARQANGQVREQRGVVLDATFASRRRRDKLRKTLERKRVGYFFVEIRASAATIKQRLVRRANSAGEISDARIEDFMMVDGAYQPPAELDARHFFPVKSARSPEAAASGILKTLARRHACAAEPL